MYEILYRTNIRKDRWNRFPLGKNQRIGTARHTKESTEGKIDLRNNTQTGKIERGAILWK